MILPGMPRPVAMGAKAPPFLLSGTFAADSDGWNMLGASWFSIGQWRTDPGFVNIGNGSRIEYTIPAAMALGLSIQISIWHRTQSSTTPSLRRLSYRFGGGTETVLDSVDNASSSYAEFTGSVSFVGSEDLVIVVENLTGSNVRLDDWSISGG